MKAYQFMGTGCFGISNQRSGTNLPADKGPWEFRKTIDTDQMTERDWARCGVEEADVAEALQLQGWYIAVVEKELP